MIPSTLRIASGSSMLLVVALGLATGAGYLCGSAGQGELSQPGGQADLQRGHRERVSAKNTPELSPVELVRLSMKNVLDERQQWRRVRLLSEAEVKAAIFDMMDTKGDVLSESSLPNMLFYRWAEIDPSAANDEAKKRFPKGFARSRQAVITAWIKQGGGFAAWEAVKDECNMWACTQSVPVEVADMLVASLSDRDDAEAFKFVRSLDNENLEVADVLCRARAAKASETPESRPHF